MNKFNINQRGFWESDSNIGHIFDEQLCSALKDFIKINEIKSIVDFGCGMGDYTKSFLLMKQINCDAFDGNPNTSFLTNGIASVLDLSKDFDLQKKYDCVLTLEVGEHIPEEYESIFLNNISKHTNKFIILSWAIEGQGGDGHINCKNNDYIIQQMKLRNFTYDLEKSNFLRNKASVSWFKNTIMVFEK
jgi:hypothetical protein